MRVAWFSLFLLSCFVCQSSALVIGIDFGARFFKIGLLQAGKQYHVILNGESQRRSSTAMSFDGTDRLFGDVAQGAAVKRPLSTILLPTTLLGRQHSAESLKWMNESLIPVQWIVDETRGTYRVQIAEQENSLSIEEVTAMFLEHIQELASTYAGVKITDAVIAVPPFFTHQQRLALLDAARIAGVTITGLINDNTATALLYGVEKEKEFKDKDPVHVLFFDMGATATRASVVRFGTAPSKLDKKGNKTVGEYWIKSVTWNEHVGALAFDNIIVDMIASGFNAKRKVADGSEKDVRNFPKAVAKIRKAAEKAKEVLSTIGETTAIIEGLLDDIDYSLQIPRDVFEQKAASLLAAVKELIQNALKNAEVTPAEISAVEVVGGGSRIPSVQNELKNLLGKELSVSLNGDDAVALGTTLYAAKVSPAHRMKELILRDCNPFDVNVQITGNPPIDKDLFAAGGKFPVNKRLTLARSADFDVVVGYAPTAKLPAGVSNEILHVTVGGVAETIERHAAVIVADEEEDAEGGSKDAKVKIGISLSLTDLGTVELTRHDASVTIKAEKETPTPTPEATEADKPAEADGEKEKAPTTEEQAEPAAEKEEKDANSDDKEPAEEQQQDEKAADDSEKAEGDEKAEAEDKSGSDEKAQPDEADQAASDDKDEKPSKDGEHVLKTRHVKLNIVSHQTKARTPFTDSEVVQATKVLNDCRERDAKRRELEAAKNELEAHIYSVRAFFDTTEDIGIVCSEDEKEGIFTKLTEAEDWLYEDGQQADLQQYRAKLLEVQSASDPVRNRHVEMERRPLVVKKAREFVVHIVDTVTSWNETKPWINETDKVALLNKTNNFEKWLNESEDAQAQRSLLLDPVFTAREVAQKLTLVENTLNRLSKIPKPRPPKQPSNSTKSSKKAEKKKKAQAEGTTTQDASAEQEQGEEQPAEAEGAPEVAPEDVQRPESEGEEQQQQNQEATPEAGSDGEDSKKATHEKSEL